jgi:hypothetical protein
MVMEYLKHKCNLFDYVHIYTPNIQDQPLHIYTYIHTYVPANIRKNNSKRM